MRVRVLYFAALRKIAGDHGEVELPEGATIGALFGEICRQHPALEPWRGAVQFSRNREWATAGERLADGDEVAIMPPVSGG